MISRRDMLGAAGAAAAALALPQLKVPALKPPPKFFTPAEFALLDELSEMIIPTDEVSAGARAAGVASYIDGRLAEALEADVKARWRSGLHAVDALAREMHGKAFLAGTAEQRVAVLTKMSAAESDPKTPVEKFFKDLKWWTVFGYYTTKIGIHDDQQYKGNVYQTGDYAGYDAT
ncbi:MAG TPA: gluconate 2-dehydrogenase subunit 3 family protein [Gemmatimonadales bacterium]|nr:gluconate 2-dehydrogenase subunit 3 family protein [Gemmatimonadales bacterium]